MKALWHRRRFMEMVAAPARTRLLRAGLQLGLFDSLREVRSEAQLADEHRLEPDLLAGWLSAAEACGLLRREGDGYVASGFVRWLLDEPSAPSLYALLDQSLETVSPAFERLPGLMRGAARPVFGAPAAARRAAQASRLVEDRALAALARIPDARSARTILDVGCGFGTALAALLRRYRDATATGIELDPDLAAEARRTLEEAGVSRRAEIVVGDFLRADLARKRYDLALLNNDLYYFAPETHGALFHRLLAHLAPGGIVAIQIPVVSRRPLARRVGLTASAAVFDLFLRCHANLHGLPDPAGLADALRAAGFEATGQVPILPAGASVYVWARSPGL